MKASAKLQQKHLVASSAPLFTQFEVFLDHRCASDRCKFPYAGNPVLATVQPEGSSPNARLGRRKIVRCIQVITVGKDGNMS